MYLLLGKGYPSLKILKLTNEKLINLVGFWQALNPNSGKTMQIIF